MSYRDKLTELGIDVYKVRGKQGKVICPKCSHTRKKKTDPCLSISIEEGWYRCHNCEWSGNVRFEAKAAKEYKRPVLKNQTQCSDEIVKWFAHRGINQMTLNRRKVMSGFTWMPQTQKEEYCMQFTYWEKGELVNIKHRDANKNFRLEGGAELIMYGLDSLRDDDEYIIITEGEIDQLSWEEAGIHYSTSVPNGASKQKNDGQSMDLEFLENSWEYFDNGKKIILATDNDVPGILLREELSRRLGKDRCFKVDFRDCKDSNEYLVKYGPDGLRKVISKENLIEYPLKGIVEIDDIWDEVSEMMDNGLPRGVTTGVFSELDKLISFDGSKLAVVTGIPNSGKSPLVDMIQIILAIRFGWKWGVCSMENKPLKMYIVKLAEKIIGKFIRPNKPLDAKSKDMIRVFIREHFFFIEPNPDAGESETLDFILSSAKVLVRKHGIKGLTIDPWNKIEHHMKNGETETNYISRALDQIIRFEQAHDLFTFLIAHPAKPKKTKDGQYEVPDLYSVSGSSNFYNKPDWGITVHRNYKSGFTEVHVNKVKWDHLGQKGAVALKYNGGNGRLCDVNKNHDFSNWLNSLLGMIIPDEPEQPDFEENEEELTDAPF